MAGERAVRGTWRGRVLGAAFELLYHHRTLFWLASTIPFAGQWRAWQRRVLPRIHGREVLEVGCGIGTLLADLLAAGYQCRAIDASPEMVAATRARLRRHGYSRPEELVAVARVEHLPFADASFDTVVSTFPTPYIYQAAAMTEIARVLRPGGRLIVVEGATLLPTNLPRRLLVLFQSAVYGPSFSRALPAPEGVPHAGEGGVRTVPIDAQRSGIPLEGAGLARREEMDLSRWWMVLLVMGEKPADTARP